LTRRQGAWQRRYTLRYGRARDDLIPMAAQVAAVLYALDSEFSRSLDAHNWVYNGRTVGYRRR
jgi:hypothetical protein